MFQPSQPPRRETEPDPLPLALRAAALGIVAAALLGVLGFRLWALQVLHSDQYAVAAVSNQLRTTALPAPRGTILDRTGSVMVGNTYALTAQINPGTLPHPVDCKLIRKAHRARDLKAQPGCQVMWHLAWVLKLKFGDVVRQYWKGQKQNHGYPVSISASVTPQQVRYVKERANEFRGVQFMQTYQRDYPFGTLAPNILGYVSRVSPNDLKNHHFFGEALPPDGTVGKQGVEYSYDRWLRGVDGKVAQSFDAAGNPVGSPYLVQAPQAGDTLRLTIDASLQRVAQNAIAYGIHVAHVNGEPQAQQGAIVAMNPDTGAIYALASWPTFDPSIWVPPYTGQKHVLALAKNQYTSPLLDLAGESSFPAGSTFKPFTAAAAWKAGILGPGTTLDCPGSYTSPNDHAAPGFKIVFHDWTPLSLGSMGLSQALTVSCDTFFYQLGDAFWGRGLEFQDALRGFGFGRLPTGYDLLTTPGLVPTPDWKRGFSCNQPGHPNPCGYQVSQNDAQILQTWDPGDAINMAIGQGNLLVTPVQEAVAYSALENGGKLVDPHVAGAILDPNASGALVRTIQPGPPRDLHLSPTFLSEVWAGLLGATHNSDGTSSAVFGSFTPTVYGKTGTAEASTNQCVNCADAWWSGWASSGGKKLVVVAMIRNGGHGGVAAAPAALRVFEAFFHKKITAATGKDQSR